MYGLLMITFLVTFVATDSGEQLVGDRLIRRQDSCPGMSLYHPSVFHRRECACV